MPLNEVLLIILIILAILIVLLQIAALLRGRGDPALGGQFDALKEASARVERTLHEEQRAGREELQQSFDRFRGHLGEQLNGMSQQQAERIDGFGQRLNLLTERTDAGLQSLAQRLVEDARKSREESTLALGRFGEQQQQRLAALGAEHEKRMGEVRATLEAKLGAIQQDNAAAGVGDLKRVLTNVKKRGIFGEVQLGALLEDMLTAEQYASNVVTVPGSNDRVEFAIRMPGQEEGDHVYLPIDAKFPVEDYQRLLDAQEAADADAAHAAGRALEVRVREEAKRIHDKYVAPPHTTDFAVLYLPTEGLYAEVIRRPGLFETLQREHRVTVAGPTTLSALLNSLQMGFRTLAIAKRSSEVWKLLGAVKSEFGKFGLVLEKAERQLNTVRKSISDAGKKTKTIERKLRGVESLSSDAAQDLLGEPLSVQEDPEDDAVAPASP